MKPFGNSVELEVIKTLTWSDASLIMACHVVSERLRCTPVRGKLDLRLPVTAVEDAFRQFRDRGLMFLDGTLAMALALPATPGR